MKYRLKILRACNHPELGHLERNQALTLEGNAALYLINRGLAEVVEAIPAPEPAKPEQPAKVELVMPKPPPVKARDKVSGSLEPIELDKE